MSAASDCRNSSGLALTVGSNSSSIRVLAVSAVCQRCTRRFRNLLDDCHRCPGRSEQPNGARRDEAGEARFGHGRKIRRTNKTRRTGHSKNSHFPGSMKFEHLRANADDNHRNLSADQVCNHRPRTPIWHRHDLRCVRERFEQLAGQVVQSADARCVRTTACRDWPWRRPPTPSGSERVQTDAPQC